MTVRNESRLQVNEDGILARHNSRILKAKGAAVSGIDHVPQFIDHARARDADSAYIEAVAENIPFVEETFDLVLSYLSIVDIPDLRNYDSGSAD